MILGKISFPKKWWGIRTSCQGSCGITVHGGVVETCRNGSEDYGLVGVVMMEWLLD